MNSFDIARESMNRKVGWLALAAIAMIALVAWTTNKSSGTKHSYATVSSDSVVVIGAGAMITWHPSFLSIASIGTAGHTDSLLIWSDDLGNADGVDTLYVGTNTRPLLLNFPHGVDSLYVIDVTTSLFFEASN
jgi:hypothetical protein